MKDTFYFSHDYNARTDEKVIELLSKHGMTGYGVFWGIVESLYNNTNVLRLNYDRIAYELHTDSKIVESVINDFGLFSIKDGFFGSVSIEHRLDERNDKSVKARQSVKKRWDKYERNTNVSKNNTNVSKNDTIKERKGNKGKENKKGFIFFWNLYDKNIDQEKCESLWNGLTESERENCLAKMPAYIQYTPNKLFRKNPENYLRNKAWENETINPAVQDSNTGILKITPMSNDTR
jgi:Domain of unknown function (DUF4373)